MYIKKINQNFHLKLSDEFEFFVHFCTVDNTLISKAFLFGLQYVFSTINYKKNYYVVFDCLE